MTFSTIPDLSVVNNSTLPQAPASNGALAPCPPTGQAASGEKAKARAILAAIRTLQTIEQAQRPATPEERAVLACFPGFGPVALGIFPDPVTGRYKDATWQTLGEELRTLLAPEDMPAPGAPPSPPSTPRRSSSGRCTRHSHTWACPAMRPSWSRAAVSGISWRWLLRPCVSSG